MRSLLLIAALLPLAAFAGDPGGKADPNLGKALHDTSCIACHAHMYGGNGSGIYTRDGRMASNKTELLQRVASCNAMAKAGWTPEEEVAVAAWLNRQYYHFDQ